MKYTDRSGPSPVSRGKRSVSANSSRSHSAPRGLTAVSTVISPARPAVSGCRAAVRGSTATASREGTCWARADTVVRTGVGRDRYRTALPPPAELDLEADGEQAGPADAPGEAGRPPQPVGAEQRRQQRRQ